MDMGTRSWHVHTKGQFAGTCIGIFLIVVAAQWLHRVSYEYDYAIVQRARLSTKDDCCPCPEDSESVGKGSDTPQHSALQTAPNPYTHALSHSWLWRSLPGIRPTPSEHIIRTALFAIQWGLAYLIMLFFMYYNGYVIFSCILGAFFGKLIFSYTETMSGQEHCVTKCGH
ncbi:uncharacterized protein J8A68_002813 [[Candida] subhashii]|uniref:Copper transport protein n=1 Tax=[Candida] subhashii TaxID=561895 RepID=A0A8J5UZY0_9ASCO|nr:uncharacterized protein J8A68_002813 [[Candida] subhashii]KAG7663664.1 hypothetical protein J8A68_002813 [[Candida] subhashii]